MISTTIQEILEEQNIQEAMDFFASKKDHCGMDRMTLSEMMDFVRMNKDWFWSYWEEREQKLGRVQEKEILSPKGKKRKIYLSNSIDRMIGRLLCQSLQPQIDLLLAEECHSYREERSTITAVSKLKTMVEEGYEYLLELDVEKYFENIDHQRMQGEIEKTFEDDVVKNLLDSFVRCRIYNEGECRTNNKGLITGVNISPMLSNLYLNPLDLQLHDEGERFVRYGDNYYFLFEQQEAAYNMQERLQKILKEEYLLDTNREKSGVFSVFSKKILGHIFFRSKSGIITVKKIQRQNKIFSNWQSTALEKKQNQYYLINDGILSKKDWTILFENEENKRYLPVEVVDNLNVYSNIVFDSNMFRFFSEKRVTVHIFDRYGELAGYFIPANKTQSAKLMMKQVALYLDEARRLEMARKIQIAGIHNLRSNLRYYKKKRKSAILSDSVAQLSDDLEALQHASSINDMMMIEARARQTYYTCFNEIIKVEDFSFVGRSRRPPRDPLNALISFGNVYLYNEIATLINKTGLDIRISIVHSANNRQASLNLDLADIFKPLIVDRVIFALINRNEIDAQTHFEKIDGGGIYLNKEGKWIFLQALEEKLEQLLLVDEERMTYKQIIQREVYSLLKSIKNDEPYRPYKYL